MNPTRLALAPLLLLAACDMGRTLIGDLPDTSDPSLDQGPACETWTVSRAELDGDRTVAEVITMHPDGFLLAGTPASWQVTLADASFDPIWAFDLGQPAFFKDVVARPDGGALAAASVRDASHSSREAMWVVSLAPDGQLEWAQDLGAAHFMAWAHTDLRRRSDGGMMVSWHSSLDNGEQPELRLVGLSADGTVEFSNTLPLAPGSTVGDSWAKGAMELLPNGNALQLTAAGTNLRLVQTTPQGGVVSDAVVADLEAWPRELEVLPGGEIVVLARADLDPTLLEVTTDGTVVARHDYGDVAPTVDLDDVVWHETLQRFVFGGTAYDEAAGRTKPFVMVTDRDGAVEQQFVSPENRGGIAFDLVADPEGGVYISRHHLALYIQYLDPYACNE